MGLIDRLRRVTLGRIEAFLDTVERPEQILPQLVRQMRDKLKQVANAEAKSLAALRGDRRRLDESTGRAARLSQGAALAIKSGNDDLARQAIAAQIEAEKSIDSCRQAVEKSELAYASANSLRTQFQRDLTELIARKDEIIARARAADTRAKAQRKIDRPGPIDTTSLLDIVSRMEEKVARQEDEIQARDEVARLLDPALLEAVSKDAVRDEEVERRLASLRGDLVDPSKDE